MQSPPPREQHPECGTVVFRRAGCGGAGAPVRLPDAATADPSPIVYRVSPGGSTLEGIDDVGGQVRGTATDAGAALTSGVTTAGYDYYVPDTNATNAAAAMSIAGLSADDD